MDFIQFSFHTADQEQRDALIALLSEQPIEGFEETEQDLVAYAPEDRCDEAYIQEIAGRLSIPFTRSVVGQRNWNEEWEQGFRPVIIDGFCSIRAGFHAPQPGVAYDIVITPKMSFGTGHHATTALMITMMRELDFRQKEVFDFGTGTGVLAILAEKLGAASILAIDNDIWSYENALENIERNQCRHITVKQGIADDLEPLPQFSIILANINRHILLTYMEKMALLLYPDGMLLLSGMLQEDRAMIRESAAAAGLEYVKEQAGQNWACMLFRKS